MKNIFGFIVLCGLFVLQSTATSIACGKKFLVKNGSVKKAQCYLTSKVGTILMYRDPNIEATENALGKDIQHTLSNAGNNVYVVDNRKDFESALKNGLSASFPRVYQYR